MRVLIASVVFASLLVSTAAAQTQDAPSSAPKEHAMTGCLQKGTEAGTFMLTNVDKVGAVQIAESTAKLEPHVTHKIEITGTAVPGKAAHTMKVSAVKMLGRTCP